MFDKRAGTANRIRLKGNTVLILIVSTGSVLVLLLVVALLRERRLRRALEALLRRFLRKGTTYESVPSKTLSSHPDDDRRSDRLRDG